MQLLKKRAVGTFSNYAATEIALNDLKEGGFSMDQIAIVGKDIDSTVTAIGSLANLLTGFGSVHIPRIGRVLLAGTAATAIVNTISGSFIGPASGSLAVGLTGLGIPAHRAKFYSDRIFQGNYIVVVDGSEGEIALAQLTFSDRGIADWYNYDIPSDVSRTVLTFSTPLSRV
jgi:hypothetical protein